MCRRNKKLLRKQVRGFLLFAAAQPCSKEYYDDFVELNKAKLGKGNVLKLGVTYTIPPVKRSAAADKETPGKKTILKGFENRNHSS